MVDHNIIYDHNFFQNILKQSNAVLIYFENRPKRLSRQSGVRDYTQTACSKIVQQYVEEYI